MVGEDPQHGAGLDDPADCRRRAAQHLQDAAHSGPAVAVAWALLAIAGELAAIRRIMRKRG